MKKILLLIALALTLFAPTAHGALNGAYVRNLLPEATNNYDLGTTTNIFNRIFARYASTTAISTTNASSTFYTGAGLLACNSTTEKLLWSAGQFLCGTDAGAGAGVTGSGLAGMMTYWTSGSSIAATSTIVGATMQATSTTATSTFAFNVAMRAASTTATSTMAGINLLTGCFAVNGTCMTANTGTVTSVGVSSSGSLTIGSSPVTTSGTITANLNMGNANTWTALQTFNSASSTSFSALNGIYVGRTATTSIVGDLGTSTFSSFISAVAASTTATSTMKGINMPYGGCFAVAGVCMTSNAGTVTSVGVSSSGSITIGSTPVTTSGTITANLNMGNANTWTALQTFTNASSTLFSSSYASSTSILAGNFSGAGLTDCDTAATSKVLWDATTSRFSCGTDQTAGGGAVTGSGQAGMVAAFSTGSNIISTSTIVGSHIHATSTTATSTFQNTVAIGTTTNAVSAKLIIDDESGTLGSAYGMARIISKDSGGGNYDIRIDSPSPDIEFIETDQTSPAGKFEITVTGDKLTINGRNSADDSFLEDFNFHRAQNGGEFVIGSSTPTAKFEIQDWTSSATVDWMRFVNGGAFAGGAPGLAWQNTAGSVVTARISSAPGASYTNSSLRFQVADSSKALQDRLNIDVNGNTGIGTTSPYAKLSVVGQVVAAYYTGTTTATSTFAGGIQTNALNVTQTNATSTFANGINMTGGCFAISGTCVGGGSSQWTTSGSDIYYSTGNVGIGTSSPYARLSVVGQVVASHFTATTSTASTFPYASTTAVTVGTHMVPGFFTFVAHVSSTTPIVATTTRLLGPFPGAFTVDAVACETDTGTVGVSLYDGTNRANYVPTASTTINNNLYSTNNTFTKRESVRVDIGTPASSPTQVTCRFQARYTSF